MYYRTTLKNGIRVIAEKLDYLHSVTFGIWVKSGSATETEEQNGMSHFIEHMMFKGTKKRSAKDIAADTDKIGGQINAFTAKEYTCYYIKAIDEKADEALDILTDIFCNSVFDETEIEKEKGVVIEEIKMVYDTPDDLAHETLSINFFKGSTLSKTILGPQENIKALTRERLLAYKNTRYYPENIVISVVGNFDEKTIELLLEEKFSGIMNHNAETELAEGERASLEKQCVFVNRDIQQAHICMGFPAYPLFDNKKYALAILSNVIGGSMSSRLFQRIREEMGMAYSVFSYSSQYLAAGMFGLYAGTSPENAEGVAQMMMEEIEKIRTEGITTEEFLQSKQQLRGNHLLGLESTSARMNSLGKNMLLAGRIYTEKEVLGLLEAVTPQEIQTCIQEVLCPEKMTCAIVGKISDEEKIKTILSC